jgi:hypothetical protein
MRRKWIGLRKTIVVLTAMAAMLVGYAGTALAASVLDQQNTDVSDADNPTGSYHDVAADMVPGQTFTAGMSGTLEKVSLLLAYSPGFFIESGGTGTPSDSDLVVEIKAIGADGLPTGAALGGATVPLASFGSYAWDWRDITLTQPARVSAGTRYVVLLSSTEPERCGEVCVNGNYMLKVNVSENPYPGGNIVTRIPDGDWIISEDMDAAFKTYVSPNVLYDFEGFFSPVDNPEVATNKAKAGSAIPVKFSLGGDMGLDIFESGYPKSQQIPNPGEPLDGVEQTVTAGSSGLSYDPTTGLYTYTWKTEKGWAGQYRELVVQFDDGTVKRANFNFTK